MLVGSGWAVLTQNQSSLILPNPVFACPYGRTGLTVTASWEFRAVYCGGWSMTSRVPKEGWGFVSSVLGVLGDVGKVPS